MVSLTFDIIMKQKPSEFRNNSEFVVKLLLKIFEDMEGKEKQKLFKDLIQNSFYFSNSKDTILTEDQEI